MTEAERFLLERLHDAKSDASSAHNTSSAILAGDASSKDGAQQAGFATQHKIPLSLAIMVALIAVNALLVAVIDHGNWRGIPVLFLPVSCIAPIMIIAKYAWPQLWRDIAWGVGLVALVGAVILNIAYIKVEYPLYEEEWLSLVTLGLTLFISLCMGVMIYKSWKAERIELAKQSPGSKSTEQKDDTQPMARHKHLKKYAISIKCFSCNKTFRVGVSSGSEYIVCPYCGVAKQLKEQEQSIKEPIACRIIRIVFRFCGCASIASSIFHLIVGAGHVAIVAGFIAAFNFKAANSMKRGARWPIALYLAFSMLFAIAPVVLSKRLGSDAIVGLIVAIAALFIGGWATFSPNCQAWLAVKRLICRTKTDIRDVEGLKEKGCCDQNHA